jgi:hypothetical protein
MLDSVVMGWGVLNLPKRIEIPFCKRDIEYRQISWLGIMQKRTYYIPAPMERWLAFKTSRLKPEPRSDQLPQG